MIVSRPPNDDSEDMDYFLSQEYGPAKPIKKAEFYELIELLNVDESLTYYAQ